MAFEGVSGTGAGAGFAPRGDSLLPFGNAGAGELVRSVVVLDGGSAAVGTKGGGHGDIDRAEVDAV